MFHSTHMVFICREHPVWKQMEANKRMSFLERQTNRILIRNWMCVCVCVPGSICVCVCICYLLKCPSHTCHILIPVIGCFFFILTYSFLNLTSPLLFHGGSSTLLVSTSPFYLLECAHHVCVCM